MITQRLYNKMRSALADSEAQAPKAIPWDTIIQAILTMLTGCFSENRPANATELKSMDISEGSENERWLRFTVIQALREQGVRATRANVDAAVARITKARAEAAEEDLQELLDCCFGWDF